MAYERDDELRLEEEIVDDNEPDQMGNYIDQLAADYLSYAPGYPVTDWRKPPRPKSARFMRPRCRVTPDGSGGAPLTRPSSAPAGRRPAKTERYRESGQRRWPTEAKKIRPTVETSDGDPLRRYLPNNQPEWTGELWRRTLRRPGLEIQDPSYHWVAQRGIRDIHEEWQQPRPPQKRRPHSARAGSSSRNAMPYAGGTANWKVALPKSARKESTELLDKPLSTGKMSLTHFSGRRYTFSQEPRYLEWDEYVHTLDLPRT